MAFLHYGSEVRIRMDKAMTKIVMETVAAHATRGGWVTATDSEGATWSFLVSAGVPIWITEDE